MRSPGSSRPMLKRTSRPPKSRPGRASCGYVMTREVTPPQLYPVLNSRRPSAKASTAARDTLGAKTIEKMLADPSKSRFHTSWPGHDGSAGCSTVSPQVALRASEPPPASKPPAAPSARPSSAVPAAPGLHRLATRPFRRPRRRRRPSRSLPRSAPRSTRARDRCDRRRIRQGLHADIDAVPERVEQHAGAVGVIDRHGDLARVRGCDNRRHVLDLHGDRPGTFGPDQRRVVAKPRGDAAADERVVALDVDVEAGHHAPGKVAMRTVDRVRNQRVVAGLAAREIHQRDGRLSARHHEGVARVLDSAMRAPSSSTVGVPYSPIE